MRLSVVPPAALSSFPFQRGSNLAEFSIVRSLEPLTGHPWDTSEKSCPTFPTWGSPNSPPSLSRHLQSTSIPDMGHGVYPDHFYPDQRGKAHCWTRIQHSEGWPFHFWPESLMNPILHSHFSRRVSTLTLA